MSDNIIDLDALLPQEVTIKLGGKDYTVPPPTTGNILKLAALSQKAEKADTLDPNSLEKLASDLTNQIYESIPGIKGTPLTMPQMFKLLTILTEMAMPEGAKELEKRGITPSDPKAP